MKKMSLELAWAIVFDSTSPTAREALGSAGVLKEVLEAARRIEAATKPKPRKPARKTTRRAK